jgi:hypothetical protein
MITEPGIISYPAIFEAKPNRSGDLKFSCSLLIDKTNTKALAGLNKAIEQAIAKGKEKVWKGKVPTFRYKALRDGDEELVSGERTGAEYKGRYFLNCSSTKAPGVVGPNAKPLMNQQDLYAGCIVRLDINPYPYSQAGNNGVGWGLNNVMLVSDGERLDGRQNAEDAFSSFIESESSTSSDLL